MAKRILLTVLTLLVIYSAVVIGVKVFEPEMMDDTAGSAAAARAIDYETLKDYTLQSGASAIHYYFFWSSLNNDCMYVADTVLRDTEADTGMNLTDLIEVVDITDLEKNLTTNRLKSEWDVVSYPAFIACRVVNGKIVIDNKLEWNPAQPISVNDLERWLILNGLYESHNGDHIETPVP